MTLSDYYAQIFVPANTAVTRMRRNGLPINLDRVRQYAAQWETEILRLEQYIEGEGAARGFALHYSAKHAMAASKIADFLFSPQGLGLEVKGLTAARGAPSTDDSALAWYASRRLPRPEDNPIVGAILKIRSLSKARSTHLLAYERLVRSDGCVHPSYNWTLRTARLSAENPPVHQIPEHADREVATAIKSCIVPRVKPAPTPEDWDPRKHGTCVRWDIAGAEAAIRAGMLTQRFCSAPDPAYDYIREGRDVHGRTAAMIYGEPDGTFKKGTWQRDSVGKQTFFGKIYGAKWRAVQGTIWEKARMWVEDKEAQRISDAFERASPGLVELYEHDKRHLGETGYCQDGYGRRRFIGLPEGVRYSPRRSDPWDVQGTTKEQLSARWGMLEHNFHVAANTPTQSMSATDTLWAIALLHFGEYVPLAVPPMWEDEGPSFPEAAAWGIDEGDGPGGKPLEAWAMNTVHDSEWLDCAPGHLEPLVQVIHRRVTAIPFDWRLEANMPYRVDVSVGPDMGHLEEYNTVAKRFGLDPLPVR